MATEKRLIDANAYIAELCKDCGCGCDLDKDYCILVGGLMAAPTVDAVEVVHGRWLKGTRSLISGSIIVGHCCSLCNEFNVRNSNYCPNCGAKMDGDGNA